MLTAAKEETFSAPMVWTNECVLPLAASGVYPKTRVWGSEPENLHCFSATSPLKIELRWGCEECSEKTAVGSGVTFKYDPFGRRIYKSSTSGTSVYAYDGDNLIEETNATGGVVARYEQTQNIDEPLAMLRSSATSYFHADGLGSITSLSGSAGSIANTYTYDSFGKLTASTGSLVNPFQYTARESDPETRLYYYRARYYDQNTGRFLTEDPLRFIGGGPNFYDYVQNDVADDDDPTGKCPPPKCFADLKFRPLDPPIAGTTHAFWYVQDRNGQRWTVSAGPAGPNGGGGKFGFLNVWVTPGSQSTQFRKDNPSAPTHWTTWPICGELRRS